jgi:hypothetical protein
MTPSNFLIRGLLAGFIAGLFTFGVAHTWGEPQVNAAIAVEDAHAAAEPATKHHHAEDGTVVSRENQSTWGLATGTFGISIALGGIVGLVSAFAVGRIGRLRPGQSTALVALVGFVSLALVPFLKYPATPPAVGNPDTISQRTIDYFSMQGISLIAAIGAVLLARRLLGNLGVYRTVLIAAGSYLVVVLIAGLLLPTVNEIGSFPADTLWYFRRASLMTITTMWAVIGFVLTGLIGKLYERESLTAARKQLAASL